MGREHGSFKMSWLPRVFKHPGDASFAMAMSVAGGLFAMTWLCKNHGELDRMPWEIPFFGSKRLEEKRLIALTDIENNDKLRAKLTKLAPAEYYHDNMPKEGDETKNFHTRIQH